MSDENKVYSQTQKLDIIDGFCLVCYAILFMYQVMILTKYLIPLGIKDRYIIILSSNFIIKFYLQIFYFFLTVLLVSSMMEIAVRLATGDPAYYITKT